MFGLLQAFKSTRSAHMHDLFTRRFYITSKSAKNSVGAMESVLVITFIFVAVLGPAGWILSNSTDSRKKTQ